MIYTDNENYYELTDPVIMPKAGCFLWNETMMVHVTCRGYATSYFMQPEPAKYSYPPNMEAKHFLLPEKPYYAHHPGRFVYVKDEDDSRLLFSAPHEPVRRKPEQFAFQAHKHKLLWRTECSGIEITMSLSLPKHDSLELWRIKVKNNSGRKRKISIYPYFSVGYMSWMNQSGAYNEKLTAIIFSSVTPYQKSEDYPVIKELKDKTFLWAQSLPDSRETSLERFEGEGGLSSPSATALDHLSNMDCQYELMAAVMQYQLEMERDQEREYRFIFGPAKDEQEILSYINIYGNNFEGAEQEYSSYIDKGQGVLRISTPDKKLDNFVNNWLPRQVYYHGVTNRMCTDPQTRNFLQDAMGMSYVMPEITRNMILFALGQQHENGEMPDGILLHPQAELKYINRIPHSDHCVWLPLTLSAYLDETGDYSLLDEELSFKNGGKTACVWRHIDLAMDWLVNDRDERGLNYIRQGDWCDPMNMVGYKGKGVSGWLTMAASYALRCWANICRENGRQKEADHYLGKSDEMNAVINKWLWDGSWYARGITDEGVLFGVSSDKEGKIFLNAQSWAILCTAADDEKKQKIIEAVEKNLETPFGAEILTPPYTAMREDIGRLTQKQPGAVENGSVYNHAVMFYIYALYTCKERDSAFRLLDKMLPGENKEDFIRRGQMPVYIPNYYRGAYNQFPDSAGRSSFLFNTGAVSWYYRSLIDGLFGLRGVKSGLSVHPDLPSHWNQASVTRYFRGAKIHVDIRRNVGVKEITVLSDGKPLAETKGAAVLTDIEAGKEYRLSVYIS